MKATIHATPDFHLQLNEKIISLLILLAENHYDRSCKACAKHGGLLLGWRNKVKFFPEGSCTATFRELDLTLKITELSAPSFTDEETKLILEYKRFVNQLLTKSKDLSQYSIEVEQQT